MNIRRALDWKRNHFFVSCLIITYLLMLKLEYSYTKIFADNITTFLIAFMTMDIFIEQLLVRLVMSEALLVSPILGTFVVTEFIMTMGAEDFRSFIISYFIETTIVVISRTYVGPWVEKGEALAQQITIKLSKRYKFFRDIFQKILVKQMAAQMQLMSLNELNAKKAKKLEESNKKHQQTRRKVFEWELEKGEGMEALLGSVNTYASQTQALFLIPFTLLFIIMFANETKIPQNYQIRKGDLQYYFFFCAVIIVPQLIIDVFMLHILEVTHGYKIYDYFTYCNYRFNIRTKKWLTAQKLDRSVQHSFRSLDSLCFSS